MKYFIKQIDWKYVGFIIILILSWFLIIGETPYSDLRAYEPWADNAGN